MASPPQLRIFGLLIVLSMWGCGAEPTAPSRAAAPQPIQIEPSAPRGVANGTASSDEPAVDAPALTNVIVLKSFARMTDCGHDDSIGDLRCGFSAAGKSQPVRLEHTLRTFLTDPPGMLLAAATWHPASKLDSDDAVVAECHFEEKGQLSAVHLAASDNGVPGWLYLAQLPAGILSDCVFSPYLRANERISAAHLLLMHDGSRRKPAALSRTREQALALALDAADQLQGADFGDVAARVSDEPGAASRRGFLGTFQPQMMVPEFSLVLLATPIGERTAVFETSFGFHIAERRQPTKP